MMTTAQRYWFEALGDENEEERILVSNFWSFKEKKTEKKRTEEQE